MAGVARLDDTASGWVNEHDGHYTSGHNVTGVFTDARANVFVNGKPVIGVGYSGTSNCPDDNGGMNLSSGSSTVFVNGVPLGRSGDSVNFHNQGSGTVTSGSANVFAG